MAGMSGPWVESDILQAPQVIEGSCDPLFSTLEFVFPSIVIPAAFTAFA